MKDTIMTYVSRFVCLAVASVEAPGNSGALSSLSNLAALGMLIVQRRVDDVWAFSLRSHAIAAGDSEDRLLAWANEAMPAAGILIGWQLAERIIPPLLDAGSCGDPEIGRPFLERLSRLATTPSVDLAISHGGSGAPTLFEIVSARGIPVPEPTVLEIESAWAFGNQALLSRHVEALAIASWRLWLAEANGAAEAASTAFEKWLSN